MINCNINVTKNKISNRNDEHSVTPEHEILQNFVQKGPLLESSGSISLKPETGIENNIPLKPMKSHFEVFSNSHILMQNQ